jgi:acetylornithine aminotransferase
MTGQPSKREPFEPMPSGVEFVPYGDSAALAAAVDGNTAAVVLEPIQGEAGVIVPPDGYLADARRITADAGALLVLDEVQTGIGRTGEWFAHQHSGIRPDVMTLAKGLGGGLPMGAVIAYDAAADLLTPGLHGSTFAGNPICAAAALAVVDTIAADRLLDHTAALGKHLVTAIDDLHHPLITQVRGKGLLIGVQLTRPIAAAANSRAAVAGFLTNAAAPDVLRLAPPLILTTEQADGFVAALPDILDAAADG